MGTKAQRGGPETYRKGVGDPKVILGAKALLASQLVQQQKGRRQRRQRPAAPAAGASRQRRLLRAARWRAQGQAAGLPRAQQACWAQAVVAAVAVLLQQLLLLLQQQLLLLKLLQAGGWQALVRRRLSACGEKWKRQGSSESCFKYDGLQSASGSRARSSCKSRKSLCWETKINFWGASFLQGR